MKTIRLFGIALLTVLMSVSFSACGGSDDDNDNGNNSGGEPSTMTNKYLVKQNLMNEKGDARLEWSYSYDSNKRISSINAVSHLANMSAVSYSYSYSDNSIKINNTTYNLSNGLITSTDNSVNFTYDSDGYITSASKNGKTITYTWSGGNMINMSYKNSSSTEESESISYEYTNLPFPQNFPYSPEVGDIGSSEIMAFPPLLNYWGKTLKNLPKKYVYKRRGTIEETITFDYTMEDGYPSIIKQTTSGSKESVSKLQWK